MLEDNPKSRRQHITLLEESLSDLEKELKEGEDSLEKKRLS